MSPAGRGEAYFPGRAAIEAYGNGGFRFAEMSHRGSLLILPTGIYAWHVSTLGQVSPASLEPVFAERSDIELVLLGTGAEQTWPAATVRQVFAEHGLQLECMDTGAAVRTYNVLLAEARLVAAALIAVGAPPR